MTDNMGKAGMGGLDATVATDQEAWENAQDPFYTEKKLEQLDDEEREAAIASGRIADYLVGDPDAVPEQPTPAVNADEAETHVVWDQLRERPFREVLRNNLGVDDEEWAAALAAGRVKLGE